MEKILLYFVIKYQGNWERIYQALDEHEKVSPESLREIESQVECPYISILSPEYPKGLKSIYKPPFILFYHGDIKLLEHSQKIISLTGTNIDNSYVKQVTKDFLTSLANHQKIIITTFTGQTEIFAHQLITKNKMSKLRMIANISNNNWKAEHEKLFNYLKQEHLIISEYPFNMHANICSSVASNASRILVGLSKMILVLPFNNEESINNLVNCAIQENKDIFAVPNQIYEFCATNSLIQNNAKLVQNIDDFL